MNTQDAQPVLPPLSTVQADIIRSAALPSSISEPNRTFRIAMEAFKLRDEQWRAALSAQQAAEPVAWLVEGCGDSLLIRHSERFPGVFAGDAFKKRPLVFGDTHAPATPQAESSLLMKLAAIAAECSDPDTTDALDSLIAATPQAVAKPLFAVAVAARKWAELQDGGARMQYIAFDGGTKGPGTIDPWGKVMWGDAAATPQAESVAGWREAFDLAAQMLCWGREEGLTEVQAKEIDAHAKKMFAMLATTPPQAVQPKPFGDGTRSPFEGEPMSAAKAAYFMRRFKHEEKLLGPNEQAAIDFVLAMLGAQAVQPQGEPSDGQIIDEISPLSLNSANDDVAFARRVLALRPSPAPKRECDECSITHDPGMCEQAAPVVTDEPTMPFLTPTQRHDLADRLACWLCGKTCWSIDQDELRADIRAWADHDATHHGITQPQGQEGGAA